VKKKQCFVGAQKGSNGMVEIKPVFQVLSTFFKHVQNWFTGFA
jgi:hypothetical protein